MRNKGFSLVEILIYFGLLMIFIGIMGNLLATSVSVKLESEATSALEQDTRFVLERLTWDVNHADLIVTPSALGETGTTLVLSEGGVTRTYSWDRQSLSLDDGVSSGRVHSNRTAITAVSFQKLGNPDGLTTVKIKFTIQSLVVRPQGEEVKEVETTVGVR